MRETKTHPKLLLAIVVIVLALTAATALVWSKKLAGDKAQREATAGQQEEEPQSKQPAAQSGTYIAYDGVEDKTALELLKANAEVITKDSSFGPYVDSINGVRGGTDNKYWAFYVNGQLAQVGANDYHAKAGDKIEWKFE